jgi:hypothetical protein
LRLAAGKRRRETHRANEPFKNLRCIHI